MSEQTAPVSVADAVPAAVRVAFEKVAQNPDSSQALAQLRRVLLMEAGRVGGRLGNQSVGGSPKSKRIIL